MSLDKPNAEPDLTHLNLGESVIVEPTYHVTNFDLNPYIERSRTRKEVFKVRVDIGNTGENAFDIIILHGEASVIETNGSFENDAESVTHHLYVLNNGGVLKLVPKPHARFGAMRMSVSVGVSSRDIGENPHFSGLLAQKRAVEGQRSTLRKGILIVMGAAAVAATAVCGGLAYHLSGEDTVEPEQAEGSEK